MDLGNGLHFGENIITKREIQKWRYYKENINWETFVWYIKKDFEVVDYAEGWIEVKIFTREESDRFHKCVIEYEDMLWRYLYSRDSQGYKKYYRRYKTKSFKYC